MQGVNGMETMIVQSTNRVPIALFAIKSHNHAFIIALWNWVNNADLCRCLRWTRKIGQAAK